MAIFFSSGIGAAILSPGETPSIEQEWKEILLLVLDIIWLSVNAKQYSKMIKSIQNKYNICVNDRKYYFYKYTFY